MFSGDLYVKRWHLWLQQSQTVLAAKIKHGCTVIKKGLVWFMSSSIIYANDTQSVCVFQP